MSDLRQTCLSWQRNFLFSFPLTSLCLAVQFCFGVFFRVRNLGAVFLDAPTFVLPALFGFEAVVSLAIGNVNVSSAKTMHTSYGFASLAIIFCRIWC